jgi:hypothetical protein
MSEIENGKIRSTMLGPEDHGIFTAYIQIDFAIGTQGFGGYGFDHWVGERASKKGKRVGHAYGAEFIRRLLEVLEVASWEKLPGTPVRVKREGDSGWNGKIVAVGHYMKDQWLDPAALADEFGEIEFKEKAAT